MNYVGSRGGDESRPVLDVHRVGHDEPYVPVDPGAGVPPRRGLAGIVGSHGENVFFLGPKIQMAGELVLEAHISVRPLA